MIVCSSRNYSESSTHKFFRHYLSIVDNVANIMSKFWSKCLSKGNSLGENSMFMWSTLNPWKDGTSNIGSIFFFREYNSTTRSSECLMCCCCYNITIRNWILQDTTSNKTSNMSNVCKKNSSYTICNLSKSLPIKISRVSRESCNNHFWIMFFCKMSHLIHINSFRLRIDTIWNNIEGFS